MLKRCGVFLLLLFAVGAIAQTPAILPSYRPASGRTFSYRLLLNGTMQVELGGVVGFAHFAATVDIEQRWQSFGERLGCALTVKGGTLRIFSSAGEQTQKLGRFTSLFVTTPFGELVEVRGSRAQSLDELTAEWDLLATALASLLIPFPPSGVRIGEAWQATHRLGEAVALTTVQCIEALPAQSAVKLRLRYTLPLDTFIDPQVRTLWRLTARYAAESDALFSVAEGRTLSASGSIRLEASWQLPNSPPPSQQPSDQPDQPPQSDQLPQSDQSPNSPSEGNAPSSPSSSPSSSAPPFTFRLQVDARFDLLPAR
jgi:hypothetical protein